MYDKEFINRVNIRQIREFFLNGSETFENEEGTPDERYSRYVSAMTAAVKKVYDDEELLQEIFVQNEKLNKLSFEMGYCAGVKNGLEIGDYTNQPGQP